MKHDNLYKAKSSWAALLVIVLFSSCIKNYRDGETKFTDLNPVVLIPEGGLAAFGGQALNFSPTDESDTFYFRVNYAATNVAPVDEKITLAVDQDALTSYNASSSIKYKLFPDSIYSFTSTEVTVKAGQSYSDPVGVVVHPSKIDPTQNYMLPISIKGAPGNATISGNFGTIYPHLIGNKYAGLYGGTGKRYNYIGAVSYTYPGPYPTPASILDLDPYFPQPALPDDAHTIEFGYANLAPEALVVTMDDNDNIVSVEPNDGLAAAVSGFSVYLASYDKATKTFHFITHYNNQPDGSGNDRIVDETYVKQ